MNIIACSLQNVEKLISKDLNKYMANNTPEAELLINKPSNKQIEILNNLTFT